MESKKNSMTEGNASRRRLITSIEWEIIPQERDIKIELYLERNYISLLGRETYTRTAVGHFVQLKKWNVHRRVCTPPNKELPEAVYSFSTYTTNKSSVLSRKHIIGDVEIVYTQNRYTLRIKIVVYTQIIWTITPKISLYTQTTYAKVNSNRSVLSSHVNSHIHIQMCTLKPYTRVQLIH